MEKTYTTCEVARLLGLKSPTLLAAIYNDRLPRPGRHGQAYLWTNNDIKLARATMLLRQVHAAKIS